MKFAFSEDQLLFQQSLRDFLEREWPPAKVRGLWETPTGRSPELWKQLAELGVTGLRVPEAHGGLGLDEIALVPALEELGRAGVAEPVVATTAVAAPLLAELEGSELRETWLKRIAVGEAIVAVGEPGSELVSDAHVADLLLLPSGDELHALPHREVERVPQPANDPARRLFGLRWSPSAETRVAHGAAARRLASDALDRAALGCAAEAIGVAGRLLDLAVAYAGQRQQFGRPIGSFQALKHALADVKVALEYARPVVQRAAHSVARRVASRARDVSHAKLAACEAAGRAARVALQVHGAIGYTWEQDLHLWMRRAWSLGLAWGTGAFHRARVAEHVLRDDARLGPGGTFSGG